MNPEDPFLAIAHGDERLAMALRQVLENLRDSSNSEELREVAQRVLRGALNPADQELDDGDDEAAAIVSSNGVDNLLGGRDPDRTRQVSEAVLLAWREVYSTDDAPRSHHRPPGRR